MRYLLRIRFIAAVLLAALIASSCDDSSSGPVNYQVEIETDRSPVTVNATYIFIATYSGGGAIASPRTVWNFGDSTKTVTAFADRVTHIFSQQGTYDVEVVLYDNSDGKRLGTGTASISVQNYEKGLRIVPDTTYAAVNTPVTYTVEYTGTPLESITWFWDFGDNTGTKMSTTESMQHTYKTAGTYTVSCILYDVVDAVGRDTTYSVAVINH